MSFLKRRDFRDVSSDFEEEKKIQNLIARVEVTGTITVIYVD